MQLHYRLHRAGTDLILQLRMITNNCFLFALFCKSTARKPGLKLKYGRKFFTLNFEIISVAR